MSVIEDGLYIVIVWMGHQRREFQRNMARSMYWAQRRLLMILRAIYQPYPGPFERISYALPAGLPHNPYQNANLRNTRVELIALLRRAVERLSTPPQLGLPGPLLGPGY